MKTLQSEILIGNFRFNYVTNVSIQSGWDIFTDTATITLPNKFRKDNKDVIAGANNLFKRGDRVEISLGYFPTLKTRFKGFISEVIPDSPLVIRCEDRMFLLKQENLASRVFVDTTIKEVIDYATASQDITIEFDDPNAGIGTFQIDNNSFLSAVDVFSVLKSTLGYKTYFENDILQVRFLNSIKSLEKPAIKMGFQRNIIDSRLIFQRDDDRKLVIKGTSKQKDNTIITLFGFKVKGEVVISESPQTGAIVKEINDPDLTKSELETFIRENIDDYIYTGVKGSFVTFLEPLVNHSDKIDLDDPKFPEKDGRYLIKKVNTDFGIDGGRQVIELQNKVGNGST